MNKSKNVIYKSCSDSEDEQFVYSLFCSVWSLFIITNVIRRNKSFFLGIRVSCDSTKADREGEYKEVTVIFRFIINSE